MTDKPQHTVADMARCYNHPEVVALRADAMRVRAALRDLLDAMETPRTRAATDAWQAAIAALNRAGPFRNLPKEF